MKFLIFLLFPLVGSAAFSQHSNKHFADTAYAFKGFGGGGSTASLRAYSMSVDTMQSVIKIQVDAQSLDTLNYLIEHVKSKNMFNKR